jgi:hypothetical protein
MSGAAVPPKKSKIFKQYDLLVEDTARLSDRRQTVSNIYLSANALLASGIALLALQATPKNLPAYALFLIVLIVFGGTVLCLGWRRLIESYRELVGLRINMLKEIEERAEFKDLGLIDTYHQEDALYDPVKRKELGKKPIFGFSRIESRLPVLFIILYFLALIGAFVSHFYPHIVMQFATWGVILPKP